MSITCCCYDVMKTRGKQELCLGNYPKPGGDEGHQDLKELRKDPSWCNTFLTNLMIVKSLVLGPTRLLTILIWSNGYLLRHSLLFWIRRQVSQCSFSYTGHYKKLSHLFSKKLLISKKCFKDIASDIPNNILKQFKSIMNNIEYSIATKTDEFAMYARQSKFNISLVLVDMTSNNQGVNNISYWMIDLYYCLNHLCFLYIRIFNSMKRWTYDEYRYENHWFMW